MKKSFSLSLLSVFTVALLTACGGGGGGSSNVATPIVTSPTTNTGTGTNTSTTDSTIAGTKITLNASNRVKVNETSSSATTDINTVVVDGTSIQLYPTGISSNTLSMIDSQSTRKGGSSNLTYTRYGYIKNGTSDPILFAQGELTKDMPTTGSAIYTGKAIHVSNGTETFKDVVFDVNFANKQISGQIRPEGSSVADVALSATINGNEFAGKTSGTNGFTTTGKFYGTNAAEIGGVYRNATGNISGAFGAKK
ncbi:MAG: transferrin-binding protein-like solute binding protein [Acinetobacter sp.]|nr:transferrin-binding protein-like solute binding protein [Acinetobacter sp.]